jgi:hypothetical protein
MMLVFPTPPLPPMDIMALFSAAAVLEVKQSGVSEPFISVILLLFQ